MSRDSTGPAPPASPQGMGGLVKRLREYAQNPTVTRKFQDGETITISSSPPRNALVDEAANQIESSAKLIETMTEALFPTDEPRGDGGSVDHSADGNLEAAIIDLEMRGADKVCLNTLNEVLAQLYKARAALAEGGKG